MFDMSSSYSVKLDNTILRRLHVRNTNVLDKIEIDY